MARIIKRPSGIFIFILVLCGSSIAQSTFNSAHPSDIPYEFLTPARPVVHGFGVTSLSSYYPDSSYKEAYHLAIEDLTANLFTSVYLESFKTTGTVKKQEFAITDTVHTEEIVPLDSLQHQGKVYYFIGVKSSTGDHLQSLEQFSQLPADTWTADLFTPYRKNGFWIASGKEKLSRFNPYKSWAKSKLDALARLSSVLHTKVQSTARNFNASYREITYITSKNLFSNIVVLRRTVKKDYCYTLLAVHNKDITQLD